MNDLLKAYHILGLDPGASLVAILRRYKRLVMVWHPDRFSTEDSKNDAEEELKKINNAKEKLQQHFENGSHNDTGPCACRTNEADSSQGSHQHSAGYGTGGSPGPGQRRRSTGDHQDEEEAARRRSEARRQQEEAEAARKAQERAAAAAQEQSFQDAMQHEQEYRNDALYWRISALCGVMFIVLLVVAGAARGFGKMITDAQNASSGTNESLEESQKHSDDWSKYIDDRQRVASQLLDRQVSTNEILDWRPPYSSPDGSPIARLVYQKLNPPTPETVNPPTTWDPLSGPRPDIGGPQQPNIDISPTLSPDGLRARIADYQAKLGELQAQLNLARNSGSLTEDQETDINKQMNALRQQIDIDQTTLRSTENGLPKLDTNTTSPGVSVPEAPTDTGNQLDGTNGASSYESFKKRLLKKSLHDLFNKTGTDSSP